METVSRPSWSAARKRRGTGSGSTYGVRGGERSRIVSEPTDRRFSIGRRHERARHLRLRWRRSESPGRAEPRAPAAAFLTSRAHDRRGGRRKKAFLRAVRTASLNLWALPEGGRKPCGHGVLRTPHHPPPAHPHTPTMVNVGRTAHRLETQS